MLTPEMSDRRIEGFVRDLDSLEDGEFAVSMLISCGPRALPSLKRFLLSGSPRTIALPRRRAARVLGELGARSILIEYLRDLRLPDDPAVLFAEDGVRSDVARELLRWKTEEVFQVLLEAAQQRATSGIIFALGEFRRPESIPLFFTVLEDDFCREDAKEALRKLPQVSHEYAIRLLRGETNMPIQGAATLRRRRATLQLLQEFRIDAVEWQDVRAFLSDEDVDVVLAAAGLGLQAAPEVERPEILLAVFRISRPMNWFQESSAMALLDSVPELAVSLARTIMEQRLETGDRPDGRDPSWRILSHVLGPEFNSDRSRH